MKLKQMIILGITRKAGKDRTGRLGEEGRGNEGSCKSCLPCFIAVVLDFDQRLLGNNDKTNNKNKLTKIRHFNIWGPKPPGPK